jgi:tight adherence protein C
MWSTPTLVALLFLAVALVSGVGVDSPMLLVGMPALGFFGSRFILRRKIPERQRRIWLGLADGLDLMSMCIKAGLPLDEAMAEVSKDLRDVHPDLSEEFYLASREMRAGTPWDEALCNLSVRTGIGDIKALTQTGLLGLLEAMRVQSDSLRADHRRRKKRQAIKMSLVLAAFLLASLVFVIIGLQLIRQ